MVSTMMGGDGEVRGGGGGGRSVTQAARLTRRPAAAASVAVRRYEQCPRVNSARPRERHGGYLLHGHGSRRLQDV